MGLNILGVRKHSLLSSRCVATFPLSSRGRSNRLLPCLYGGAVLSISWLPLFTLFAIVLFSGQLDHFFPLVMVADKLRHPVCAAKSTKSAVPRRRSFLTEILETIFRNPGQSQIRRFDIRARSLAAADRRPRATLAQAQLIGLGTCLHFDFLSCCVSIFLRPARRPVWRSYPRGLRRHLWCALRGESGNWQLQERPVVAFIAW